MRRSGEFWFLVRDAAVERQEYAAQAVGLIVEKQLFNKLGFPLLKDLRGLSRRLKTMGYKNGKGSEYHPDQLRVDIFKALTDLSFEVLQYKPTKEQWNACYQAIVEGCTQREHNGLSEEDECRQSWRGNPRLRKPLKRQRTWDDELDD